ncbi:MAG: manganese-dependent inorganic pyrophosphatase [bacterium]|nr:manganese-dependent inorganic pyrophosphatase [bacterium]
MIKVFGHISPDTDTVGSAVLWAWHLNNNTAHKATPYVLGKLNKETSFVLSKWGIDEPELLSEIEEGEEVVIVDTNNPEELLANISEAKILGVIDHHKLIGGISTDMPIEVTMRPYASTATVIYELMGESRETLPENVSGVMLSCILSDTLAFRSPTTTPHDKEIAEKLAKKLGVDITEYSNEMFKAKSDMSDYTDVGLIHLDSKKFEVGDKKIRVSVIETMDSEYILSRKDGLIRAIKEVLEEEKDTDEILLFVVSILKEEATVLTYNQFAKDIISTSFNVTVDSDMEVLPGVVSRKKQIFPALKLPKRA